MAQPSGTATLRPINAAPDIMRSACMLDTMVSMLVFMAVVASSCENCANWATKASFFTGSKGFWFFNWVVNRVKNCC